MKLLMFADESMEAGRRLFEVDRQAASKAPIEIGRTVKCLGEKRRLSLEGDTLAIVLTKSIEELRKIQALSE